MNIIILFISLMLLYMLILFIQGRRIRQLFIVTLLIFTLLQSCCILKYFERTPDEILARAIAFYNLNDFSSVPEFADVKIGPSWPTYDNSGMISPIYDVKLIDQEGKDKGYMIVNTDHSDFPVMEFTLEGPCLTEQFHKKLGHRKFRILWITPSYTVALDSVNHIIGMLGSQPNIDDSTLKREEKMSDMEFLEMLLTQRELWRTEHQRAIRQAWHHLPSGGKKSSDLVSTDEPSGNYAVDYAEGYDRSVNLRQIDNHTGANNNDYSSGCGATAWANLIAWHDHLWTPEALRGTQTGNSYTWGNPVEPMWDTYLDRVMMHLGREEYLDTHDCAWVSGNTGITHDDRMMNGFNYIREKLNCFTQGVSYEMPKLQKVYDCIVLDERPVLIKTPNHFCVAAGFWYHISGDNHYILLKTGWSGPDKWIKSEYLEKYWYVKNLLPNSKVTTAYVTTSNPVLCTTPWGSNHYDHLWYFGLDVAIRRIHYIACPQNELPDFNSFISLNNVRTIYPPSVIAEASITGTQSGRIYLLYVDESHSMHLLVWNGPDKQWDELKFPTNLKTYQPPALCGVIGNWLTVAFYDNHGIQLISTCADVQREGAWPSEEMTHEWDRYWFPLSFSDTDYKLNLFPYKDKYILLYMYNNPPYSGLHPVIGIFEPDGEFIDWIDFEFSHSIVGAPSVVYSNETLFVAYKTNNDRIVVDQLNIWPSHTGHLGQREVVVAASATATEMAYLTEKSHIDPSLGMIDLEEGKHPTLILCWNDYEDAKLNMRLLSIDYPGAMLNYEGKPY